MIFNDLKENDPKTHIIISIAFVIVISFAAGFMVYLTAITKYEGYHIYYAIAGGFLLFLNILWLVNIMKNVSGLKTDIDWLKRRIKLAENAKLEIILEKMKKEEPLDSDEFQLIKDIESEVLEKEGE